MTTKGEILQKMADDAGITKAQATIAYDTLINTITTDLRKEGRIAIASLGTFTVGRRAARTGRNPATGEPMKIKASNTTKFKAAPVLKEAVAKFKAKADK